MITKRNLPPKPGVYIFKENQGKVIYIGKAINLKKRVQSYNTRLSCQFARMIARIKDIDFIVTQSDLEALILEASLIKKYKPKFNIRLKDDKHFLYIKISSGDEFPKVTTSRKENDPQACYLRQQKRPKGVFFGPFPSAKKTRDVLRIIRRIFPFCSQKTLGKRACFYSHLGLCHPCPSNIVKFQGKIRKKLKKKYLKNIDQISKFLNGQSTKIIVDLEKKMRRKAKQQKFEEAAKLRDKILKLKYITQPREKVGAYLENFNFLDKKYKKQLDLLFKLLKKRFGEKIAYPARIEGYDISNISGKEATGAMVVFEQGDEEKKLYRRFKIKFKKTPDDVACLIEVFKRRLEHKNWLLPQLIVVDGGKAQVGVFLKILEKKKLFIPVLGLAKQEERVIAPLNFKKKSGEGKFECLELNLNSTVLNLLKRVRDEAHRFARAYHLKLRLKELIK